MRSTSWILACAAAAVLAACGGGDDDAGTQNTTASASGGTGGAGGTGSTGTTTGEPVTDAFMAFVRQLVAASSETSEPVGLPATTTSPSETAEPGPV